jgi:hypothetical protein
MDLHADIELARDVLVATVGGDCSVDSALSVLKGTRIEIGMTPVTDSTWLIDEVSMKLSVAKLRMFKSTSLRRSTYSQYRPNAEVLEEFLSSTASNAFVGETTVAMRP